MALLAILRDAHVGRECLRCARRVCFREEGVAHGSLWRMHLLRLFFLQGSLNGRSAFLRVMGGSTGGRSGGPLWGEVWVR
jgi:hypothetical protein